MNMYMFPAIMVFTLILLLIIKELIRNLINPSRKESQDVDYKHYVRKNYLMSIAERKFYDILVEIAGDRYHVIPQMVLSNIVEVNKYERNKFKYRNMINRRVLDFVIFEKPYFVPHIVVELDDTSHLLPDREDRDFKVNTILETVGINVVHVKTAHEYIPSEIKANLGL